jgi:hypothetical protein
LLFWAASLPLPLRHQQLNILLLRVVAAGHLKLAAVQEDTELQLDFL